MKINIIRNTVAAIALVMVGTSCDKVKDLADVDIDTDFEESFSINVITPTEPDSSAMFTETGKVDLNDGEVADYVDNLKDLKVTKAKLIFDNYVGPASAEMSGQIDLGGGYMMDIPPTNIQDVFANTQEVDLTPQAGAFNYMKDQLLSQKMISYTVNGRLSEVPVMADFRLVYSVEVTANPL